MIYKNGIKTIVQFNTDRYVTSLMKKQCETFDKFFSCRQSDHGYANKGSVIRTPISSREPEINNYKFWMLRGTDSDSQ